MKLVFSWVLFACLLAAQGAELPQAKHSFIVIAHRACHTRAHENTLTALKHAIEAGMDYAEIDVRRTVDGQYVLMHDSTVDRMTDGHGAVASLTLAQVRGLAVRDRKRPEIPPDRVPTLDEVLVLVKGKLNLYLDFKSGERAAVAKAIRDAGVTRQILVYDAISSVPEWRRVMPELPLIVSLPGGIRTAGELVEFARKAGVEVLDGDWSDYSREMVDGGQAAGIKVWPDIQDGPEGPEYYQKVLERGFSGAQTDHPEQFIAWLRQQSVLKAAPQAKAARP